MPKRTNLSQIQNSSTRAQADSSYQVWLKSSCWSLRKVRDRQFCNKSAIYVYDLLMTFDLDVAFD